MSPEPEPSAQPRRRARLARLLALGLGLVVALAVGELAARIAAVRENARTLSAGFDHIREATDDPNAGIANIARLSENDRVIYELIPNLRERSFSRTKVSTDEHGFRVAPPLPEDDRPLVTILGIGDSIMFGHGVEDKEPYLYLLQLVLQEAHPECRWRVINAAVPGYNTVMEVETLRVKGLAFEPDIVILNLVGNDYAPPKFVRREIDPWTPRHSFLLDFFEQRAKTPSGPTGIKETPLARGKQWYELDVDGEPVVPERYRTVFGPEAFRSALRELKSLSEQHDFAVLTFTTYNWDKTGEMIAAAKSTGFQHADMMPMLHDWLRQQLDVKFTPRSYISSALVIDKQNAHPSRMQHGMAAQFLHRELLRRGLLEPWVTTPPQDEE